MKLVTEFLREKILYSGAELQPQWVSRHTGQYAPALIAFLGPCDVAVSELVDMADVRAGGYIRAKLMLHFLGEFFGESLELTVARQRLLISMFADALRRRLPTNVREGLVREGDDLFLCEEAADRRKFSVAIVTGSPNSTLLHFGVNVDPTGAPVPAVGLQEFSVEPQELAEEVLFLWQREILSQEAARCKVLPRS